MKRRLAYEKNGHNNDQVPDLIKAAEVCGPEAEMYGEAAAGRGIRDGTRDQRQDAESEPGPGIRTRRGIRDRPGKV